MTKDENCQKTYSELMDIAEALRSVHRIALIQYSALADDIVSGHITDEYSIEHILDGLIGFCDSPECLKLFKRICVHLVKEYPRMVKDYIDFYQMMYGEHTKGETQ